MQQIGKTNRCIEPNQPTKSMPNPSYSTERGQVNKGSKKDKGHDANQTWRQPGRQLYNSYKVDSQNRTAETDRAEQGRLLVLDRIEEARGKKERKRRWTRDPAVRKIASCSTQGGGGGISRFDCLSIDQDQTETQNRLRNQWRKCTSKKKLLTAALKAKPRMPLLNPFQTKSSYSTQGCYNSRMLPAGW